MGFEPPTHVFTLARVFQTEVCTVGRLNSFLRPELGAKSPFLNYIIVLKVGFVTTFGFFNVINPFLRVIGHF